MTQRLTLPIAIGSLAKKFVVTIVLSLCSLLFTFPAFSQTRPLSTKSKKAEHLFMDAGDAYNRREYERALKDLERATREDPSFIEAYILLGDIFSDARQIPAAIAAYRKAIEVNPDFSPNLYYITANNELLTGQYQDAKADFAKFISYPGISGEKKERSQLNIKNCDFGLNAMAHPVPFHPVNLGDSVNTPLDEYVNAITSDEQRLYFTRKLPRNARDHRPEQ